MTQARSVTATFITTGTTTTFADVPESHWAYQNIERLYQARITTGCDTNPLRFCPEDQVLRDQMALFILRGMYGSAYQPPAVGASTGFHDVPTWHWAADYIKQLAAVGVTTGCGGGNYCPGAPVSRDQMALFILRGMHGGSYQPPPVGASTGFHDVPTWHWAAPWIKQLAAEGITTGCGGGNYCPDDTVTRAQMAAFLVRAFLDRDPLPDPSNPIKNGDFEAGPDGSWTEYSLRGWDLIVHANTLGFTPHGGQWAAWLGGGHNERARLSQSVTIPTNQFYLHFHYYIYSEDYCGYDYAYVKINNATMATFNLCTANNTSGWVHRAINLSAYADRTVTLMFEVTTDSSLFSSFYLDTVSLRASAAAPPHDDNPVDHTLDPFLPKDILLTPD